jgi:F0F1-type ATP synthase assembly protein I
MLPVPMEPAARPSFQPAAAGGLLLGVLAGVIGVGALIGWLAGSVGYGILIGAVIGLPLAVFSVYRRYRGVI